MTYEVIVTIIAAVMTLFLTISLATNGDLKTTLTNINNTSKYLVQAHRLVNECEVFIVKAIQRDIIKEQDREIYASKIASFKTKVENSKSNFLYNQSVDLVSDNKLDYKMQSMHYMQSIPNSASGNLMSASDRKELIELYEKIKALVHEHDTKTNILVSKSGDMLL